jgi:AraC-like DNA-binding protein
MNRISRPALGLQQFVRYYTTRKMKIAGTPLVHPIAARAVPVIAFDFGDLVDAFYHGPSAILKSPKVVVVGPQTHRRIDLHLQGALESFTIMFQPDGLYRLFSIPMYEFVNEDFDGHAVLGAFISQIHQRLSECASFEERICIVNAALLRRAPAALAYDGISSAANRILVGGSRVPIASFAGEAGLSTRQFERKFIEQVGMRPKLFARIARFEAALDYKAHFVARSWTDVAHRFGYYDQMHMVHDFTEFTGETPTSVLRRFEAVFGEQQSTMRSADTSEISDGNARLFF